MLLTVVFKDGFHLPVEVTHGYVGKLLWVACSAFN